MEIQGVYTKQSLVAPEDRPEVRTMHPGGVNGGRSPLSHTKSAALPCIHLVPPPPTKNVDWPRCRVGGGLPHG